VKTEEETNHKDRTTILSTIGGLLILIGGIAAFVGPVEMYCFTLFSEGGRFHYEGFGFGSFMFGNIACQIMGYYLIAIVCIPLGYGHVRLRRWAQPLTLALLWSWTVVGVPLSIAFLFALLSAKPLSLVGALIVVGAVGLAYPLIPGLLIRFYRGRDVRMTFANTETASSWIERLPVPILVLAILFAFYVIVLHALILFNGLFPLFGYWVTELPGIALVDVASLCLVGLIWGTLTRQKWAWWGSVLYFTSMTASWILTLATSTWSDILTALDFPSSEMERLSRLPAQGLHFAVLAGFPLLLTIVAVLRAKACFEAERPASAMPRPHGQTDPLGATRQRT
jgi:hypothetical protein